MTITSTPEIDRNDLIQALAFVEEYFTRWHQRGLVRDTAYQAITARLAAQRSSLEAGGPIPTDNPLRSPDVCWSCRQSVDPADTFCDACGGRMHSAEADQLRYLIYLAFETKKLQKEGTLPLSTADGCLAEVNERITALRRKLDSERIPMVLAVTPAVPVTAKRTGDPNAPPRRASEPRRNLLEILLDPRSIQWLLVSGGVLLVLGLVIWLAAEGIFENKEVLAVCMGLANGALLAGGWAVIHSTRHEMAGRALTLLACLLMPLNLWFYDAQGLITLEAGGHLWIPALVCCALYAGSARILRDPLFVYVFVAGIALTGLLILADHSLQRFWEIAGPSTLLVVLALLCIHAERVFPDEEGPFTRRRFGLAFFWSGHVLLVAGLLLLLVAQACGDWLFFVFKPIYDKCGAGQPEIVTTAGGKLLALCLVLAGTYAYAYSDLVVRRIGVYLYVAVFSLLWAEVLALSLVPLPLPFLEVAIIALAVTALAANFTLAALGRKDSAFVHAGPPLGLALSILPVALGVLLHLRATSPLLDLWPPYELTGSYVVTMLVVAVSCRVSALLFRHTNPGLSTTYFFGTGAATLVGAAGLLKVFWPELHWQGEAPLLMLIPILYLLAARLYRGHTPERLLLWVAHGATGVMLVSSIGAAFNGFVLIERDALNLSLATFFGEAALFYLVEAVWRKHELSVYAFTAMGCAAVWQLLKYSGVADEYYTLTFAVVGLLLLIAYRFAVLENLSLGRLAEAALQSGNALLSLALVAGALLVLSELAAEEAKKGVVIPLLSLLIAVGLLAVPLVRQPAWRRWYVSMSVINAALIVLVLAVLGHLTPVQKLEVVCLAIGLLLLIAGHAGWYREQERQSDMVTLSLFLGSLLVAVPLTVAVLHGRWTRAEPEAFYLFNEIAMLVAGLLLLATGFMCQIKSTTLSGACTTAVYLVSLLLFVRMPEKLQTTAVYLMIGGGLFFATGLLLSLYRDRLLTLPDRVQRREGLFRVLTWR
jgi:hypothetical protein